jgi:NhaA family Na+:H+ antiporter
MNEAKNRLPIEPIDRFTFPFRRFLRIEAAAGGILLVFTLCAVIASNSPWSSAFAVFWDVPVGFQLGAFEFSRSIKHWINDALMTLFFFIVALELKRELVLGELRNPRMAALSFSAALGGMIVPATLYLLLTVMGGGVGIHGWGTVMATDTAFVIGCMAILGDRIPLSLRLFLLSLAIFDDVGAILVIAIGYGDPLNWSALAYAAVGLVLTLTMARLGVRGLPAYFAVGGLIWLAVDASGIHPTVVGVVLGLMTPARSWISDRRLHAILNRVTAYPPGDHWSGDTKDRQDLQQARTATREVLSPVERLEILLHPWVAFLVLPLFALANAGVSITGADFHTTLAAAVFVGFVLGKPLGVFLFSYLAVQIGLAVRPPTVSWTLLAAGGLLTGIGFTMALFIGELAFDPDLLNSAKLGIFGASLVAGAAGVLALMWLTRSKSSHEV